MKRNRYFAGFLQSQANWLNKMADQGYRLIRTGKLAYEFETCLPGAYRYQVEYIGDKSMQGAAEYAAFLEDCGYRVFYKNINLNWSVGKVVARPWAEPGGRLTTSETTLNRELLIVEKENDGTPFLLHTTYEDTQSYYRRLRKPWLYLLLTSAVLGILMCSVVWGVVGAVALAGLLPIQIALGKLKRSSEIKEW